MVEAVAKKVTKVSCAFKRQVDIFIGKKFHVGISQGKEENVMQ